MVTLLLKIILFSSSLSKEDQEEKESYKDFLHVL